MVMCHDESETNRPRHPAYRRGSAGWLAWQPTGVPEAPQVTPERTHDTKTSRGKATPVDSEANQPGLPRCTINSGRGRLERPA